MTATSATAAERVPDQLPGRARAGTDPIEVLLVEDNPGDARLVEEELRSAGDAVYAVDHVRRLEEALARLASPDADHDVVLLDLSLPDSHGLQTVVDVHDRAAGVPIVVLTGLEDEEMALEALQKGVQDYVVKGDLRGQLTRAIRYAIERQRTADQVEALRRRLAADERLATLGALVAGVSKELRAATTEVSRSLHRVRSLAERAAAGPSDAATDEADEAGDGDAAGKGGKAVVGSSTGADRSPAAKEVADAVGEAMEGLARVDQLVQDLRRFYRTGDADREAVPLDDVVREAVEAFRTARPKSSVDLVVDLEPTAPVTIQPLQVRQVVLNLLDNAVDAAPDGGRVTVRTRPAEGGAEVAVADDGPGIPDAVRERIFDPFVSTKEASDGLGLSVARRIVLAHGGEIRVDSSEEGSTFTVVLPVDGGSAGGDDAAADDA